MDWEEAQQWCNFVLMKPDLPPGWKIESAQMRPEAPPGRKDEDDSGRSVWTRSNRSSHRTEIQAGDSRVRVKQFLYDWAPPSFDHPSLWLSETGPFRVGEDIAWLGSDYRKLQAASLHLDRTMIEVSVIQGELGNPELKRLCRGFSPVSPADRERILATCFGELSYQWRHPDADVIAVPVGYWAHKRTPADLSNRVLCRGQMDASLPGVAVRPPRESGYGLDTAFVFGEPSSLQEIEYVYQRLENPGHTLRVLVWPPQADNPLEYPPQLDRQPCWHQTLAAGDYDVFYAYRDEAYGPHEAVWKAGDSVYMLLVKPLAWTDRDWFFSLLGDVMDSIDE